MPVLASPSAKCAYRSFCAGVPLVLHARGPWVRHGMAPRGKARHGLFLPCLPQYKLLTALPALTPPANSLKHFEALPLHSSRNFSELPFMSFAYHDHPPQSCEKGKRLTSQRRSHPTATNRLDIYDDPIVSSSPRRPLLEGLTLSLPRTQISNSTLSYIIPIAPLCVFPEASKTYNRHSEAQTKLRTQHITARRRTRLVALAVPH